MITCTDRILPFRFPDKPRETTPNHVASLPVSGWIAQAKYDGWRMAIHVDPDGLRFLSRVGRPLSSRVSLPTGIAEAFSELRIPPSSVLDAEFVGPRGNHQPCIYIFDCLAWDGQWLGSIPYQQRWAICRTLKLRNGIVQLATTLLKEGDNICISPSPNEELFMKDFVCQPDDPFLSFFNFLKMNWIENGGGMDLREGIVLKRRTGTMILDRRTNRKSQHIFKLKYRDIREARY